MPKDASPSRAPTYPPEPSDDAVDTPLPPLPLLPPAAELESETRREDDADAESVAPPRSDDAAAVPELPCDDALSAAPPLCAEFDSRRPESDGSGSSPSLGAPATLLASIAPPLASDGASDWRVALPLSTPSESFDGVVDWMSTTLLLPPPSLRSDASDAAPEDGVETADDELDVAGVSPDETADDDAFELEAAESERCDDAPEDDATPADVSSSELVADDA